MFRFLVHFNGDMWMFIGIIVVLILVMRRR